MYMIWRQTWYWFQFSEGVILLFFHNIWPKEICCGIVFYFILSQWFSHMIISTKCIFGLIGTIFTSIYWVKYCKNLHDFHFFIFCSCAKYNQMSFINFHHFAVVTFIFFLLSSVLFYLLLLLFIFLVNKLLNVGMDIYLKQVQNL